MSAVTIHDLRTRGTGQFLAFDLIDILRLCESLARTSSWRVTGVECTGDLAEEFHAVSDSSSTIAGDELLRLAQGVSQVIDGDFKAFDRSSVRPWLVVRAIDSTFYAVITRDLRLLENVRQRFEDVREAPAEAEDVA